MDSFIFYQSFIDALDDDTLSDADFRTAIKAICGYALNGIVPKLSGVPNIVFKLVRPQLDANIKRREGGKKGGRPSTEEQQDDQESEKPMVSSDTVNEKPMVSTYESNEKPMVSNDNANEKPMVSNVDANAKPNVNVNVNVNDNVNDNAKEKDSHAEARRMIIDYLNQRTGSRYSADRQDTKRMLNGRLNEGFTIDDFKRVIDCKVAEWTGTDMARYIQPSTLFAVGHFEEYLEQARKTNAKINAFKCGDDLDDLFF